MRATGSTIGVLVALTAVLVAWPAHGDDATTGDARKARSWGGAASFATRGWLDGSLPRVYVSRALDTAADEVDDLARDVGRRAAANGEDALASRRRLDELEATVRRLKAAVDGNDREAARRLASALDRTTSGIEPR